MAVIPSTDVNLATEVRDVLNSAGGSVGNELVSFFKSSANINKWARYKPVVYKKDTALTEQEHKLANYGLSPIHTGSVTPQTIMSEAIAGTDFYPHRLPIGGVNEPYRLSDFTNPNRTGGGYNTEAKSPYIVSAPNELQVLQYPAYCNYLLVHNPSAELRLEDLAFFEDNTANGKMGILWAKNSEFSIDSARGTIHLYYPIKMEDSNIDDGIDLTLEVNGDDTYHFIAVWFNFEVDYGDNDVSSLAETFLPVPGSYHTVNVIKLDVYATLTMSWDALSSLYYNSQNGYISGFAASYPVFDFSFPDGTVPSFTYRLGVFVEFEMEGATYSGTWWYDDELLYHSGGTSANSTTFVNFPDSIYLGDITPIFDPSYSSGEVTNVTIRFELERVSGQGLLSFADGQNPEREITIT